MPTPSLHHAPWQQPLAPCAANGVAGSGSSSDSSSSQTQPAEQPSAQSRAVNSAEQAVCSTGHAVYSTTALTRGLWHNGRSSASSHHSRHQQLQQQWQQQLAAGTNSSSSSSSRCHTTAAEAAPAAATAAVVVATGSVLHEAEAALGALTVASSCLSAGSGSTDRGSTSVSTSSCRTAYISADHSSYTTEGTHHEAEAVLMVPTVTVVRTACSRAGSSPAHTAWGIM